MLEANGYVEAAEGSPPICASSTPAPSPPRATPRVGKPCAGCIRHNPDAGIVVMGCYATRDPDTVGRLPGVAQVITDKARLVEELAPFGVVQRIGRHLALRRPSARFVKVQDGCLLNCSYCIIPHVRPSLRSRPPEEIVEEVRRLVENGYREIVLTGIHLGHYGIDLSRGRPKSEWMPAVASAATAWPVCPAISVSV